MPDYTPIILQGNPAEQSRQRALAEAARDYLQDFTDRVKTLIPEDNLAFGVPDSEGLLGFSLDNDGNGVFSGTLNALGGITLASIEHFMVVADAPFSFALIDGEGWAAQYVTTAGEGAGGAASEQPQEVSYIFAEAWTDPSRNLAITWVSDSATGNVLNFRETGDTTWQQAKAFHSRPFPDLAGFHLHTARIEGLDPATVYDLNPEGSDFTDTVRTSPDTLPVKFALASDWQVTDYGTASTSAKLGQRLTAEEPDVLLLNGDYATDNGIFNADMAATWMDFMRCIARDYRGAGGALIPLVASLGNHEGANESATVEGALWDGDGRMGFAAQIFSSGYHPEHPTRFADGAMVIRIGWAFALIVIDTDQFTPLADQLEWFVAQLARHAPKVTHVAIMGHVPPFPTYSQAWYEHTSQARTLRNQFWTAAQAYPNVRYWFAAHTHALHVSPQLTMDYDAGQSLAANDLRWQVTAGGIRQIGNGPAAAVRPDQPWTDLVSSIDASSFIEALLYYDGATHQEIGSIVSPSSNIWHAWTVTIDAAEATATAHAALSATDYYTVTDSF